MSKDNLSDDVGFRKQVDFTRLEFVDAMNEVRSTAFGGGWTKYEEQRVLDAINDTIELLNEWRRKNAKINGVEPTLELATDGDVVVRENLIRDAVFKLRRLEDDDRSAQSTADDLEALLEGDDE